MKKRWISIVLCVLLVLSLLPAAALAEGTFTVTFQKGSITEVPSGMPLSQTVPAGETVTKPDDPSATGYTFLGWYQDADGRTSWDFDTDRITGNTTLYGVWKANSYTVSFNANGGYGPGDMTAPYKTVLDLSQYIPLRSGCAFGGWFEDSALSKPVSKLTITKDTILYAKWTTDSYTLSFHTNGGSAILDATYGQDMTVNLDSFLPTRDNYVFDGWYLDSTLKKQVHTVTLSKDITVYAKWRQATYSLHFDTGSGTSVNSITENVNTVIDLSRYTPSQSGYTFTGWYLDAGCTKQVSTVKLTQDITVYAGWISASGTRTLTFDTNGGSSMNAVSRAPGSEISLADYTPTRSGFTFSGWYYDADLTRKAVRITLNEDATVYAGWISSSKNSTLTFRCNGGTNSVSSLTKPTGTWVDLLQYCPTRSGYRFTDWYSDADLTHPINGLTLNEDTTVYAGWSSTNATCTLSFNTNGGSKITSITKPYGTTINLSNYEPSRNDYAFVGWFSNSGLTKEVTKIALTEDTTVYAKWADETCTLSFNTNGGSKLSSITKAYGTTLDLSDYEPTRSDAAFVGWYSNSKLTNKVTRITLEEDTTVYAKWSEDICYITFHTNGGSSLDTLAKAYGATVDLSDFTPKKEGYVFDGWYTNASFAKEVTKVTLSGDMILYAKWADPTYTLRFNTNSEDTIPNLTKTKGTTIDLTKYTPFQSGKVFAGWYSDANLSVPVTSITLTQNTTVYAKWSTPIPENPFLDVSKGAYYYDAVLWAAAEEITSGMDETHFYPDSTCDRAQAVTFLWRAAGSPTPASTVCPFADVNPGAYYYYAVLWAVENGITTGTGSTTFSPDRNVNRAQTVTFLYRFAQGTPLTVICPFADASSTDYFFDAMLWAYHNGITSGVEANRFDPWSPCLRSQIVTFLYRCIDN